MKIRFILFTAAFMLILPIIQTVKGNINNYSFNELSIEELTVPSANIESYRILDQSEGVKIVEIKTKDGHFIINVIAAIATTFLPEIVEGICTATVGDPDACAVAYAATSALVSLCGVKIYKGTVRSIRYIANRGYYRSSATVETSTYNFASKVKDAFDVYRDYGCVKWDDVGYDDYEDDCDCTSSAVFYSNVSDCGNIKVWVSGKYMGTITHYWTSGTPSCGQNGTVTITGEPGTYRFEAESDCGHEWSGTITIEYGSCNSMKLTLNR